MSIRRLLDLDRSSIQFPDQLDQLLHDKEYVGGLQELPESELIRLVDYLNNILIHLGHSGGSSRKCLQVLRKICGSRKVLPTTYELSRDVLPIRQLPDAPGTFGDDYEGTLSMRVCIKRLKMSAAVDRGKVQKAFCREAVVWGRLNHPNIVPFMGVTFEPLQLVSEWMAGGELRKYIQSNRDSDLIRLSLGVSKGLAYLHSHEVIHGDLRGSNIKVDEFGNARITSFGLAVASRDSNSLVSTSDDVNQPFRWTAPEILCSGQAASKASDVFSFGMVMIEVFTGNVPFNRISSSEVVMLIMTGIRPGRPNHPTFTIPLWTLTQKCWGVVAQDRPMMYEVTEALEELVSRDVRILQTPSAELPTVTVGYSTTASHEPSARGTPHKKRVGGGGGAIPNEVGTPQPGLTPLRPSKDDAGGPLIHEVSQAVARGATDGPLLKRPPKADGNGSPSNGSTVRTVSEREAFDTHTTSPETVGPSKSSSKPSPRRRASLTPSTDTLQQPHHNNGRSSGFHDQSTNPHDCEEGLTLPTSQQVPLDIADPVCHGPPLHPLDSLAHPSFNVPGWKRLISDHLTTSERTSLITTIFSSRDQVRTIKDLCGDDAQSFIDTIYEALDSLDHVLRVRCLHLLCKVCGAHALLPRPLAVIASYDQTGVPLGHGGFADVWKGRSQDRDVAIKVLKLYQCSNYEQIRRRFCKEVIMWGALRHPNVLPLVGVAMTDAQFAMVTEWMVNGNINEFLKVHPEADRLGLLGDVGKGLDYLHSQEMIHGDLKGANILIDHEGRACIADFGLLTIISDRTNFVSSISHVEGGTAQWMSPELHDPDKFGMKDGRPTRESDCYALGMVIYEVLSGRAPFPRCTVAVVIRKIMDGKRPERPQGESWFTDDLWRTLEHCWEPEPDDRPGLSTILQCLGRVAQPSRPPSPTPTTDDDTDTDTDTEGSLGPTVANASALPTSPKTLVPTLNHPRGPTGPTTLLAGDQPPIPPQVNPPPRRSMKEYFKRLWKNRPTKRHHATLRPPAGRSLGVDYGHTGAQEVSQSHQHTSAA